MRQVWIVVLAVALVAVGIVLRDTGAEEIDVLDDGASVTEDTGERGVARSGPAPAAGRPQTPGAPAGADEGAPADHVRTSVRVVDTQGRGVAGVEVAVLPVGAFRTGDGPIAAGEPLDLLRSGRGGAVDVSSLDPGRWTLEARADGRAGQGIARVAEADSEEAARIRAMPPVRIVLQSQRTVTVRVLGPDDRPVPDAIVALYDPDARRMPPSYFAELNDDEVVHGVTNAAGEARFGFTPGGFRSAYEARRLKLYVLRFGGDHVSQVSEWRERDGVVVMRVPTLMRVVLRVVDGRSDPLDEAAPVVWGVGLMRKDGGGLHVSWTSEATFDNAIDTVLSSWGASVSPEGQAVAAFAPGATLTFRVRARNREVEDHTVTLPGGDRHELTLTAGPGRARLRLAFRDTTGAELRPDDFQFVIAGRRVSFARAEGGETWTTYVAPGVAGRLEIRETGARHDEEPIHAVDHPALAADEDHDLGVVAVPRPPLLVAGRIVGTDGNGLANVTVTAVEKKSFGLGAMRRTRTGVDGSFEIFGTPREHRTYGVEVGRGWTAKKTPFQPGDRDVELVAYSPARLGGNLLITDAGLRPEIRVELEPEGGKPARLLLMPDGSFESSPLVPGVYRCIVKLADLVVHDVSGIEVSAGRVRPDSLKDIPVGEGFSRVTVHVHGPDGEPLANARVTPRTEGDDRAPWKRGERTNSRGEAKIIWRAAEDRDIEVSYHSRKGPKLRTARVASPTFPLTVKLAGYPTYNLVLSRDLPEREKPWELSLARRRTAEEIERIRSRGRPGRHVSEWAWHMNRKAAWNQSPVVFHGIDPGIYTLVVKEGRETVVELGTVALPEATGEEFVRVPVPLEAMAQLTKLVP